MKYSLKTFIQDARETKVDRFSSYERGKKVTTILVPVPWARVFLVAFANALLIIAARTVYFAAFGKPEMFAYHSTLEEELVRGPTDMPR